MPKGKTSFQFIKTAKAHIGQGPHVPAEYAHQQAVAQKAAQKAINTRPKRFGR